MPKRRPRAQVRKNRDRGQRGSWDWRSALGSANEHGERFLPEEEEGFRSDERILPRGAREKSPRPHQPAPVDAAGGPVGPAIAGEVMAFRGQLADVRSGDVIRRCAVRGRLETDDSEDRSLLVVGDRVEIVPSSETEGIVERIMPRTSALVRADKRIRRFRHLIAANIDRVVLIASAREPDFRPGIVDRFLVAASSQGIPASIVVNKLDLVNSDDARRELDECRAVYRAAGIGVAFASVVTREGLDEVEALLRGHRAALVGHSGVGKSSLLNALDGSLGLVARDVNRKTRKGTHTTSVAEIFRLASGIEVVDTPGLRELEIIDVSAVNLEAHFPEFLPLLSGCEMDNCAHLAEPGCEVRRAVEDGRVPLRRYQSYVDIRAELEASEHAHER